MFLMDRERVTAIIEHSEEDFTQMNAKHLLCF